MKLRPYRTRPTTIIGDPEALNPKPAVALEALSAVAPTRSRQPENPRSLWTRIRPTPWTRGRPTNPEPAVAFYNAVALCSTLAVAHLPAVAQVPVPEVA